MSTPTAKDAWELGHEVLRAMHAVPDRSSDPFLFRGADGTWCTSFSDAAKTTVLGYVGEDNDGQFSQFDEETLKWTPSPQFERCWHLYSPCVSQLGLNAPVLVAINLQSKYPHTHQVTVIGVVSGRLRPIKWLTGNQIRTSEMYKVAVHDKMYTDRELHCGADYLTTVTEHQQVFGAPKGEAGLKEWYCQHHGTLDDGLGERNELPGVLRDELAAFNEGAFMSSFRQAVKREILADVEKRKGTK